MMFSEYIDGFSGKRVAVVGAGVSNKPLIVRLLESGIDTTICDKSSRFQLGKTAVYFEKLGGKLRLGNDYLENLDADVIFRTPGLMPYNKELSEAKMRGASLTSEMEAFFELCPCKTIAVTGSDGKTTTTSIIGEILKKEGHTVHIGGNIGTPLLCKVDDIQPDDIAVLELSSFQLITMKKSPDIAVFINITPNHLDIHKDMDEYAAAKCNIFMHQKRVNRAVFNYDNEFTRRCADSAPAGEVLLFSRTEKVSDGVFCGDGTIFDACGGQIEQIMKTDSIILPGVHNLENYMAAICAVRGLAGRSAIFETAQTFCGVRHRIELIGQVRGVKYYNDSIATSPARTIAGLRAFDRKVILIAGGKDKGVPFDELSAEILKSVKTLVLTGMTAEAIKDAVLNAPGYAGKPKIILHSDFIKAIHAASETADEGDIVLLSPACSSFDRFSNFEERGELFRETVLGL